MVRQCFANGCCKMLDQGWAVAVSEKSFRWRTKIRDRSTPWRCCVRISHLVNSGSWVVSHGLELWNDHSRSYWSILARQSMEYSKFERPWLFWHGSSRVMTHIKRCSSAAFFNWSTLSVFLRSHGLLPDKATLYLWMVLCGASMCFSGVVMLVGPLGPARLRLRHLVTAWDMKGVKHTCRCPMFCALCCYAEMFSSLCNSKTHVKVYRSSKYMPSMPSYQLYHSLFYIAQAWSL